MQLVLDKYNYTSARNMWLKVHPDGRLTGIDGVLLEELAKRTGITYSIEKSQKSFVGMTNSVKIINLSSHAGDI